jgi:hypothetical protein
MFDFNIKLEAFLSHMQASARQTAQHPLHPGVIGPDGALGAPGPDGLAVLTHTLLLQNRTL